MLWKELTQVANRRRFRLQVVFAAAGMTALFAFAGIDMIYPRSAAGQVTWYEMARFGFGVFAGGSALLTIFVCLCALASAAAIVSEEHIGQRLSLLLVTPLGGASIVVAKLGSVLARSSVVAIAALPVFALLPFFGGVEARLVVCVAALLVANVWFYGCLGLLSSVVCRTKGAALNLAAGLAILYNSALFLLLVNWQTSCYAPPHVHVAALSPFFTFIGLMNGDLPLRYGFLHAAQTVATGSFLLAAAAALFRPLAMKNLSGGQARSRKHRRKTRKSDDAAVRRTRKHCLFGFGKGVISKELCSAKPWHAALSLSWFAIFYTGIFAASLALDEWAHWYTPAGHYSLFLAEAVGVFLFLSLAASMTIVRERRKRTLQPLLLTRLGRARIVFGKAAALVIQGAPALALLAVHLTIINVWVRIDRSPQAINLDRLPFLGLPAAVIFSIALGLYFSVAAKKEVTAGLSTVLTWFLGGMSAVWIGAAVASVQDGRANRLLYAETWAATAILIAISLALGRRRGHALGLSLVTYVCVSLAVILSMFLFLADPFTQPGAGEFASALTDDYIEFPALTLPVVFYTAIARPYAGVSGRLQYFLKWGLPGALFLWMTVSVFWSFEAQAKKE
ncbi:MAG: hypothetical protein ACYTAN_06440 [Planctomycetota bacterium]|jgi:hypothetical protein